MQGNCPTIVTDVRREYGSHGSINASSQPVPTNESFFAMLQDYRPTVLGEIGVDQRSPGPTEFLKGKVKKIVIPNQSNNTHSTSNLNTKLCDKISHLNSGWKLQKHDNYVSVNKDSFVTSSHSYSNTSTIIHNHTVSSNCIPTSATNIEEHHVRRAFAHYDCQSLTANLGYAAKLRGLLLAKRRNTTTGASAASMLHSRPTTPDAESEDEDHGDGQGNDLLESCPFFRNEIGGEEERVVSLVRVNHNKIKNKAIHRPTIAYGVAILENEGNEVLWERNTCAFKKSKLPIESIDHGARYYEKYFYGRDHQNWFGIDDHLGPIAISIIKEKLNDTKICGTKQTMTASHSQCVQHLTSRFQFRLIIRTSQLLTLRGSIIEDSIFNSRGVSRNITTKDVLEYIAPEIQLNCLRLGISTRKCEQQLIKIDEQGLTNKYKVGILYCRADQSFEEDMYNNEDAGPSFIEFLELIGTRVRLKGFQLYKAGLDNKTDSTGTYSLYTTYQGCEIMFHVSTMLPFTQSNRQQLLRKRHIGNDIVTIIFQEPGALPFTPRNIRSQFQHVFIVIKVINPCSDDTNYKVSISRSKDVPVFGPPLPANATFHRGKSFVDFLLAKLINAENAVHRSKKFVTMAIRTRQEYLKDLISNYSSTTTIDSGIKFQLFTSKKKEKNKVSFSGGPLQRGAFCWKVVLQDSGMSTLVECFLGISFDTLVLIEESSLQILFVAPTKSILGWSTIGGSLKMYYHHGECVTINMKDSSERDEQLEVIERLRTVTLGCGTLELTLKRNQIGQLGFHVQPDGIVTQVESSGQAWSAGLRKGYRLVEICKIAIITLSHDQMVDLLKTSAQVTITVIESFPDLTPRRGCLAETCDFNELYLKNENNEDLKNCTAFDLETKPIAQKTMDEPLKQLVSNRGHRYDRKFSPPVSSNSSGYGTCSSSRSFKFPVDQYSKRFIDMGIPTSASSTHSVIDDRWFNNSENVVEKTTSNKSNSMQVQSPQKFLEFGSAQQKLAKTTSLKSNSKLSSNIDDMNQTIKEKSLNNSVPQAAHLVTNNTKFTESDKSNYAMCQILKNLNEKKENISLSPSSEDKIFIPPYEFPASSTSNKVKSCRTNRSHTHFIQRNGVHNSNNTLREELLKLITPDDKDSNTKFTDVLNRSQKNINAIVNSNCLGNISVAFSTDLKPVNISNEYLLKKKSRSREKVNVGRQQSPVPKNGQTSEQSPNIIFTTAIPATVISQTQQVNNTDNFFLHIREDPMSFNHSVSVNKNKVDPNASSSFLRLTNKDKELDWSALVGTATRAMMHDYQNEQNKIEQVVQCCTLDLDNSTKDLKQTKAIAQRLCENNPQQASELCTQLVQLEEQLLQETQRRKSLEQLVKRLTEENRRLQDESQAAVQQLRRFTQWFFQTIDKET